MFWANFHCLMQKCSTTLLRFSTQHGKEKPYYHINTSQMPLFELKAGTRDQQETYQLL